MTHGKAEAHGLWAYRPGQVVLDKYELIKPIAEGGSSVVWVAHNRVLDVDVAVKLTRPLKEDKGSILTERALNEARVCAKLVHPAVCRVLDFALTQFGDPCVVTELLQGQTLDELLEEQKRVPAIRAVQIVLPILDGLAAAHAKGIVHRDVKPANIFLAVDADGNQQPKLLDFGIARWMNDTRRITVPGTVCGTPYYMSPEQARGSSDLDLRSDIWSLCATLYELVTGTPPFDGENYPAMLTAILGDDPKPITDLAAGDERLWEIIARGLSKSPADRYASANELASDLAGWLLDNDVQNDIHGRPLCARVSERPVTQQKTPSLLPDVSAASWSRVRTPPRAETTVVGPRRGIPRTGSIPEGVVRTKHPDTSRVVSVLFVVLLLGSGALLTMTGKDRQPVQKAAFAALPEPDAKIEALVPQGQALNDERPHEPKTQAAANVEASDASRLVPSTVHHRVGETGAAQLSEVTSLAPKAQPAKRQASRKPMKPKASATSRATERRKTNAMGYDFGL